MRTLWNVVSFLAVVHLLALLMAVGWLWHSQRLTIERVQELRGMFAMTAPEAEAVASKAAQALEQERVQKIEDTRRQDPALDSAGEIVAGSLIRRQEEHARQRLEDERRALLAQIAAAEADLAEQSLELQRQQAAWEQAIAADRTRKTDEQFLQTVRQYEQAAPKQAKQMLVELIEAGNRAQAVAYLDSMSPRASAKILREFKDDSEIALAAKLLEELRTFGLTAGDPAAGTPPGGAAPGSSGSPSGPQDASNASSPAIPPAGPLASAG